MEKSKKIEALENSKKELTPKAKFWNQNSLFLFFGFSSAIMLTSGIELFKIFAKDYSFKWEEVFLTLFKHPNDFYLIGILCFFIFGFVLAVLSAKIIDKVNKDTNTTLKIIDEEIKKLKSQK